MYNPVNEFGEGKTVGDIGGKKWLNSAKKQSFAGTSVHGVRGQNVAIGHAR